MKNSKRIMSLLMLFAMVAIGASAQTPRRPDLANRQITGILQRLEQNSNRFRSNLNTSLINARINETRPQNDINSFVPAFQSAVDQFADRFTRRVAVAADVQNILQSASLINGFMTRNRLNPQVQNNWTAVRTDLNSLANAYGVAWQWNRENPPQVSSTRSSRLSDGELNRLIQRIETGGDTFRSSLTEAFGRRRYDQTTNEANINDAVRGLKNATEQLRSRFDARQPVGEYVERVLAQATPIDTYMRSNPLNNRAQNDWSTLRGDLNTLAGAYNLSTNWQNGATPQVITSNRLTGTFQLDSSRSDNFREVAERATRNLAISDRQRVYDRMLARLESPDMLAIERLGSTITLASSRARQATFEADGQEHQEQLPSGRSSRVTATLQGEQLTVSSTGYRENDFNVTFEAIDNGRRLRVTRELFSERLTQPVVVNSIYNRTSEVAQWNVYDNAGPAGNRGPNSGEFIVRDGETVVAALNNDLTTKQSQPGDRFTMTVRNGAYQGAVIEGSVGSVNQGGRLAGRSGLSLNFDTIRLRNGRTYKFAGTLSSVRMLNGETVKVDNEGSAQGGNQTTQTITRAGIGTAIGAIIGAVAGGGKGAAIGGIIGAAGGAGSVYVTGKDNLELPRGTELTITASAPR
jgi:uncharacterized membrane protein